MSTLKKYAAAIVTLALAVTSAASCGGNTQSATSAADTTASVAAAENAETEKAAETETQAAETSTTEAEPEAASGSGEASYTPDASNVKLIGRTLSNDGVLWLAQSASGIEFTFKGTHASIDVKGDGSAFGSADSQARFAVYVNGERKLDEMVDNFEKSYEIFSSDSPEDVTVSVIKLSESANSTFGISSINVTSENGISPTPAKDLKIEFIGDSITCGYGVDDEDRDHHFSTKTEDATKTYAYKTAAALDADYSFVSYSGHGIVSGYSSNGEKVAEQIVPPVYEQFAKTYGSSAGLFDETTPWDFSAFVPDYIVINLGTNDISYVTDKERREEFISGYADFIKQVRNCNPDSHIVCALGTMGASLNSSVKKAVERYTEESGDTNVTYLAFAQQSDKDGLAADWHPTEKTHEKAAERLVEHINSLINGESTADAA